MIIKWVIALHKRTNEDKSVPNANKIIKYQCQGNKNDVVSHQMSSFVIPM